MLVKNVAKFIISKFILKLLKYAFKSFKLLILFVILELLNYIKVHYKTKFK